VFVFVSLSLTANKYLLLLTFLPSVAAL